MWHGDPEVFSAEIFGFHVQQVMEKALKAWLRCLGVPFPKTHDLDELAALLEQTGQKIPDFVPPLLEFTDFAVAFRYEAFPDMESDIDRQESLQRVNRLLQRVRHILSQATS